MRRCQFGCGRVFTGDVCPGCHVDHVNRPTGRVYACARCGDPFVGHVRGPQVRYCAECKPARRRETWNAYFDRWPIERRRAHWRAAKAKQRGAVPLGFPYLKRKRAVLRKALRSA